MNFANFTERDFRVLIALVLVLAPLGNLGLSFSGSMVANWYYPDVLLPFLKTVPLYEWGWLALLVVGGICLLFPKPAALNFSVFCVALVSGLGIYRWFIAAAVSDESGKSFALPGVIGSLLALTAVASFRFEAVARLLPGRLRRKS